MKSHSRKRTAAYARSYQAHFTMTSALALTALLPTVALRGQNLVTNGDFSANAASYTAFPGYSGAGGNPGSITGWVTENGTGINGTLAPGTGSPFAPATNVPSFHFMQGDRVTSQAVTTAAGTLHQFSFDAAARNGNTAGVTVFADNTQAASLTLNGASYGNLPTNAFQRFAFGFTGAGAQTIQFNSSGTGDHTTDLTNVAVTAVAGNQFAIGDGTVFFTNTSGTSNSGFALTGNNQSIYRRPGNATYTGNVTTDGSGGGLSIRANENEGGNNLIFSGSTMTLGPKNFIVTGTNVDSEGEAANSKVTLNNTALTTTGNVQVGRGTLELTGNTSLTIGGQLRSGVTENGNTGDWARFVMNPGTTVTATGGVDFAAPGVIASSLHLDGGTLTTPFIRGNDFATVTHVIFNGTTVVASAPSADFLQVRLNGTGVPYSAAAQIKNGGAIFNTNGNDITIRNALGNFAGNNGTLTKSGAGTLTLSSASANTYTGATTVSGGTLKLQASPLITDNFTATGNPNTGDLNFNLANRQTGSAAPQNLTGANNAQVGNSTFVQQPAGTNGDYLLLANGGSATYGGLQLSAGNAPGPLKVSFDMFLGTVNGGNPLDWTSFTLRSPAGQGFPVAGSGEFGFLYRNNTGIQMFNNGGLLADFASTTGGSSFGFYLADAAGTGSPFAGNGAQLVVTQGGNVLGGYALNSALANSFVTIGSIGSMIGGVDNLAVRPFQTNVLDPATNVSLTAGGAALELDAVNQTVASLSGPAGTAVNLAPLSRLNVSGAGSSTFGGVVSGNLGNLAKGGAGTLTLTGANTYTGTTSVNGGTLLINGDQTIATGLVSVASGATLGGTGVIGGNVNVLGILAPGNSPGILTVNGDVLFGSGSTLAVEINGLTSGPGYDQLAITGTGNTLNLAAAGNNLDISLGFAPPLGTVFTLATVPDDGGPIIGIFESINGAATSLGQNAFFNAGGTSFLLSYQGAGGGFTGGNDLAVMVIPEPGRVALLGMAGALWLGRRRRK